MGEITGLSRKVFVDLDGTLLKVDVLQEALLELIKTSPLKLFTFIKIWLSRGRAAAKVWIFDQVELDLNLLPANALLVDYLLYQKTDGRDLILATASPKSVAEKVSTFFGIFSDVIATDEQQNVKGANKLELIRAKIQQEKFEYAGNSVADLPIWAEASEIILVSDNKVLLNKVRKIKEPRYVFNSTGSLLRNAVKTLRIHQWAKNLLLFVPMIMAHRIADADSWLNGILAFMAFSLCASGVYIWNDLMDLKADRLHRSKKDRPLASGNLPVFTTALLSPFLFVFAAAMAMTLNPGFGFLLLLYFVLTSYYSINLKKLPIIDILVLSGLYSLRILAGGAATQISVSPWLLAFSLFFFLSLASVKRFVELARSNITDNSKISGRGYYAADLAIISQGGIASGFISVLVLALYIQNDKISALYHYPNFLWMLCPVLLYWIFRIWILAGRGAVQDDPVVFALSDRVSYYCFLAMGLILFFANVPYGG